MSQPLSRRAILSTLAACSAAPALAAHAGNIVSTGGDDAGLLAAFRRWSENEARFDELRDVPSDHPEYQHVMERSSALCWEIGRMPAHTAAGLCIKLYVLAHLQYGAPHGKPSTAVYLDDEQPGSCDEAISAGLFRDALRIMPELNSLMGGAA